MRVLLAEDEKTIAITLRDDLAEAGHEVTLCQDGVEAARRIADEPPDVLISDIRMPGMSGIELLGLVKERHPEVVVILITGFGDVESAVAAMRAGAWDYLLKPFYNQDILRRLEKIQGLRELVDENRRLKGELEGRYRFDQLIGKGKAMQELFRLLERIVDTEVPVLIQGESGTGKELVARAIHFNGPRRTGPFVSENCAALSQSLLESELFGHEAGSFTGATKRKQGLFELADGGTLFLDEVGETPPEMQKKLLRALQESEVRRIGGTEPIKVDIRLVAATNADLWAHVQAGKFREDLYYRLNVVPIRLPPLRSRAEDIPLLVQHFLARHAGEREHEVPPEVLEAMCRYRWPGNVRELENAVERAIALAGATRCLRREHLLWQADNGAGVPAASPTADLRSLRESLAEAERIHIQQVLRHTEGHKAKAAEILGISRKNLWEKMKEHQLE